MSLSTPFPNQRERALSCYVRRSWLLFGLRVTLCLLQPLDDVGLGEHLDIEGGYALPSIEKKPAIATRLPPVLRKLRGETQKRRFRD